MMAVHTSNVDRVKTSSVLESGTGKVRLLRWSASS